ncbi:MAG: aminotransferase class I/II-fold pyridoxal phosphate-dependent enzyme [bacterium]|nr:aminotransferase class I/II-fold pyridoxal phosphate-dependent enzyme [bacterium]
MNASHFVADKVASVDTSGIRRIFDMAATMTGPLDLSIGQPDFDVPEPVKQAAIEAIRDGHSGYTPTRGLPALCEGIGAHLGAEFATWDPELMVTCGVSGGLLLSLMACLNPGDEVIYGDPYFVSYKSLPHLVGGRSVIVPLDDGFQPDPERFAAAITPRTKLILLNSPSNPTGVVHEAARVQAIAELARKHDLLIVSDEIYNLLSYETRSPSPVDFAPERTLLLRGFGKSYGMTGWRMGYAAGPSAVITSMMKIQQYTFVCAPHMAQRAALTALETDMSATVRAYGAKRDLVTEALADKFEFVKPQGGFYVFPKAPAKFESGTAFVEEAIRNNVLIIPGGVFSEQDTHFRISYAADNEVLTKACAVLCALAD